MSFGTYITDGYERLCLAPRSAERHLNTFLCARYMTEMCIYTSCTRGYVFLYVLPRYEACETSRLVRYIEVYVIANYVIASQFSMELMLFRRGLSVIVHNSEVYVILRVVISRFDL